MSWYLFFSIKSIPLNFHSNRSNRIAILSICKPLDINCYTDIIKWNWFSYPYGMPHGNFRARLSCFSFDTPFSIYKINRLNRKFNTTRAVPNESAIKEETLVISSHAY